MTGAVPILFDFEEITIAGDVAYLNSDALMAVDISQLEFVGSGAVPFGRVYESAVSGNHIVVGTESFLILPAHCPATAAVDLPGPAPVTISRLAQNRPNPFDPAIGPTDISFTLSGATRASLQMFDVNGRRVRILVDQMMAAGEHRARWDGRNDQGEPVASGVYFYRLRAGEVTETRTLVKLR